MEYLSGSTEREDQRDAGLDAGQGRLPGHLARDRRACCARSACPRATSPATCTRSRTPASARPVTGESHAWVEWWDGGWNGFDPTNSVEIGTRHVTLGRGRDYGDVPPFKGLFSGPEERGPHGARWRSPASPERQDALTPGLGHLRRGYWVTYERTPEPGQPRAGAQGPRHDRVLDDVSLGVAAGERIGVVGRNGGGKTTLLSMLTGADEPDSGRVTRRGDLAMGVLDQSGTLPAGTTVRDVVLPPSMFAAEHEWAGDAAVRAVLTGLELDRLGPGRAGRADVRRRAPPGRAGRAADPAARPAGPRRADQPPRRRGRRLAGRVPQASAPAALVVVTHDRWFLDEVCTTHVGGRRRRRARLRRRLRGVRAGPGRAGADRGGHRGAAAEPAPQGAGLAAPRPAGPHLQAEVPDRGGRGADRRRAAGRATRWRCKGFAARRLGKTVYDLEDVDYAVPTATARARCSRTSPGTSARATGSASSASTARARRRCCGCWPASSQPDAGPGRRRADRARRPTCRQDVDRAAAAGCGCWRRCRRSPGSRRIGNQEISASTAGRAVRLRRRPAVDAGRRPLRRRAAPAAAAAAAAWPSRTCCCSTSRPTTSTSTR